MINPTLPEWDSECSDIAGELFEILDTNDDNVLNQKDSNPLLTKRNSKLIANKVKDLGGFQLDFVSISPAINHMACYKFERSQWWKIYFKTILYKICSPVWMM